MKQFILFSGLFLSLITFFIACNNNADRPNGWYIIKNGTVDSVAQKPFVTVKDFQELHIDSLFSNNDETTHYMIAGRVKSEKLKEWGDVTEEAAKNKQSIGFIYNGKIISNPYPNYRIDGGNFSIYYMDGDMDATHLLKELQKEMD